VPVDVINIGHWLRLLLGAPTTTGTTPNYTHSFGSGAATLPSQAIEVGYPDVPTTISAPARGPTRWRSTSRPLAPPPRPSG
jgi:hypothetical protein